MKAARFITPFGSVTLKADNDEAAKEFASHFALSVLPESERCPITWLQVFSGTREQSTAKELSARIIANVAENGIHVHPAAAASAVIENALYGTQVFAGTNPAKVGTNPTDEGALNV